MWQFVLELSKVNLEEVDDLIQAHVDFQAMVIWVVEFLRGGFKLRQVFEKKYIFQKSLLNLVN